MLCGALRDLFSSDIILQMDGDVLDDESLWQFEYTGGIRVCDMLLCIFLAGARCQEYGIPLIIGVSDIAQEFVELYHYFLLTAQERRVVHPTPIAHIIRCLRGSVYLFFLGDMSIPPITPRRGFPQGGKLGPKFHNVCLATVWRQCQCEGLGFNLETVYVPFLLFSNNCAMFVQTASDSQRIVLQRVALEPIGCAAPG